MAAVLADRWSIMTNLSWKSNGGGRRSFRPDSGNLRRPSKTLDLPAGMDPVCDVFLAQMSRPPVVNFVAVW
jgi:hypothetical protein